MFWRMIFQLWRHDLPRKSLAFLTIFLASALIAGLLAVSVDIGDKMSRELKSYGANILIDPAGGALLPDDVAGQQYFLDEKVLPSVMDIFWRNNIYGFAPLLSGRLRADGVEVAALGTFFDHPLDVADETNFHTGQKAVSPFWQVAGDWPDDSGALPDEFPLLAGVKLASEQGWQTGKVLSLSSTAPDSPVRRARIVGILTSGAAQDGQLVLPLAALQDLLGLQGKISAIQVAAMTVPENDLSRKAHENPSALDAKQYDQWYCTAYVSTIAHQLEETVSGSVVRPMWQVAASEGVVIEKIQLLLIVCSIAALISAGMGIASLTGSGIMARAKEIGLMRALGAKPWQIALLFYAESLLVGALGGLLGCAGGALLVVSHDPLLVRAAATSVLLVGDRLERGQGVQGAHRRGQRGRAGLGDEADLPALAHGGDDEGGGAGDGRLQLLVGLVGGLVEVEDDEQVGAAGLLELADHEAPGAGRGAPVDVAAVVAGDVVAQGVEGDVGAGQVLGDGALDVAQDAVQDRAQTHGARVDVDVLRGAQGAFALEQSHRIALDRQDRPHGDDAATLGGQDEAALVDGPRGQGRDDEDGPPRPHRHLHARGQQRSGAGVGDGQTDESVVAHGDAGLEQVVVDRVAGAGNEPQPGAHHDDADGGRGAPCLLPAHDCSGQPTGHEQRQTAPSDRGHDVQQPAQRPQQHRDRVGQSGPRGSGGQSRARGGRRRSRCRGRRGRRSPRGPRG